MDQELQTLSIQLADVAVRHTAVAVTDRVRNLIAQKKDKETIAELQEIIFELQNDKAELLQIAQALVQSLVAQRLGDDEVEYITTNIVPVMTKLVEAGANEAGNEPSETQEMVELIKPILSKESVTVLQLVGFNFKEAIGQPLTDLVRLFILSKTPPDPGVNETLRVVEAQQRLAYLQIAANQADLEEVDPDNDSDEPLGH